MEYRYTEGSYPKMNKFVEMLRIIQTKEDFDALIGVTGFKGFGKSSFSIQIARRYVEKYFPEKKFTVREYTAMSNAEVLDKVDKLPEYSPLCCDEAVNFALGEDWNKSESKEMKKVFTKFRNKHLIVFFNIPDLWWIDKKYRENMMNVWVHILKKGEVMVSLPNMSPANSDRWYKDWLEKSFKKVEWNYFTDINRIKNILVKYPCRFEFFTFPKLPEKYYQEHLQIRNETATKGSDEPEKVGKREYKQSLPAYNLYNNPKPILECMINRMKIDEESKKFMLDKVHSINGDRLITMKEIAKYCYYDPEIKKSHAEMMPRNAIHKVEYVNKHFKVM